MAAPSGSAGFIGSINPSIPIAPNATGGVSGSNLSDTLSGSYNLNILSPGSSLTAGAGGMFLWVVVGLIGFVLLFHKKS